MINKAENKDMASVANKESKTQKEALQEYHFAGGTEFKPATVLASNQEEANKIYSKEKLSITN